MKYFNEAFVLYIFLTLDIRGINDIRLISRPIHSPSLELEDTDTNTPPQRLRWTRGSVLAFNTQVRRSRRIFKGEKFLSMPSFGGEVKPSVPCRRFEACKRTLKVPWKSCI
jgi:hypothetical protein